MVTRRPRLSGIVCLQCEFRLFHTIAQRRLPRFTAPAVLSQIQRQAQTWAQRPTAQTNHLPRYAPAYFHSGQALRLSQRPSEADVPLTDVDVADERLDENITEADAEQIWNSLLGEEGEPTEAEVFSYIDELRPTDETILSETAFSKSARELAEGFTVAQLHAYIRKYRKPTALPTVYPWEVRRRPWVPDVYGDEATVDSKFKAIGPGSSLLLKGYIQTSMTNKERVVVQLMRECWGVSIREMMEAPGQLDVTVQELEFALLTAGAETWLRDISTAYSTVTTTTATTSRSRSRSHSRSQTRHHRHIELLPSRQKLRVFAPASTADAILAEINGMLREATTKRFRLADVARPDAVITPAVLRAVGTLTGSWVRLSSEEEKDSGKIASEVLVSWVAAADRNTDLEDTGDMVYRLLLRAFGPTGLPPAQATSVLDYVPLKKSKARFLTETDEGSRETWPWEQRRGKWARLIEPAPLDASTARQRAAGITTAPSEDALPMELTLPTAPDPDRADSDASQKWYQTSQTSTFATFGRVLHAQPTKPTGTLFSLEGATSDIAPPLPDFVRILSPTVPPLLGLSSLSDSPAPATEEEAATAPHRTTTSTTIVLHFLPDPKTPLASRAPPLEVFLDAVPGQRPVLASLHVVTAINTSDVLFPTQPVDARIIQKQFFAQPGADMLATADAEDKDSAGFEPLFHFLEQSQLQLDGGQPGAVVLATPLRLDGLGLPLDVLLPADTGAGTRHEQAAIDYVFASLEVRRRVATAFEGWTAALTSVEAGRGDGRWTELSLEAIPATAAASPFAGEHAQSFDASKESFRQAVGHMVHGDRVQWLMRHRQVT
jgi:hypothetical protein